MRVLFAYGYCGLGGVETSILNRCEALRRRGIETIVFFREFYGTGGVAFADRPQVRVGLPQIPSLLAERFDVICVIDYPDFVSLARAQAPDAALLLETHSAHTTRLVGFHQLAGSPSIRAVIVPSSFNRAQVLRVGEPAGPIHLVPNGIDTARFQPQPVQALRGSQT